MKKEGRKKQARSCKQQSKQQSKAAQHTQGSHFSKGKMSCLNLGWDSNPMCTCTHTLSHQGLPERSPPVVRGKSTFFQRSSAASALSDLQELRRSQFNPRPSGQDMRPNTSSTTFRAESGKHPGKKVHVYTCINSTM